MKCEQYPNLIDDLIDGELDGQSAGAVNRHVFACAECAVRYEAARREKEIYARYLFDAEPPTDLWAKFQAKLESENQIVSRTSEKSFVVFGWRRNLFGFRGLNPAFAGAVLIVILGVGFGLSKFMGGETAVENKPIAEANRVVIKSSPSSNRNEKNESTALLPKAEIGEKIVSPAVVKSKVEDNFGGVDNDSGKNTKFVALKSVVKKKQTIYAEKKNDLPDVAQFSENEARQSQLRALESETSRQIEKIELLLRSFRNARSTGESGKIDVAYEKLQAGKLLEKNVRLRQGAEIFGTFYTEEILDRVEPYLLDISNLENNPSPEKVREIKERVKNQNIIAGLQGY